ncbi:hypothetical protein L0B17_13075 [Shewanella sp. OMA3-2]|nr:hypothetical protein [Shewanella sp. OMA3-2]UJF21082.1 hypothetical protein L0B17_13075 [Shewanella sp. OMA3-2]
MWWRVLIITLAYLLIGAHFLRFNNIELAVITTTSPLLMFIKHVFITRLLQLGLILSSIFVWGFSTAEFIDMRINLEAPWMRLVSIMAGVIVYTLFAAYLCNGLTKRNKGLHLYYSLFILSECEGNKYS